MRAYRAVNTQTSVTVAAGEYLHSVIAHATKPFIVTGARVWCTAQGVTDYIVLALNYMSTVNTGTHSAAGISPMTPGDTVNATSIADAIPAGGTIGDELYSAGFHGSSMWVYTPQLEMRPTILAAKGASISFVNVPTADREYIAEIDFIEIG